MLAKLERHQIISYAIVGIFAAAVLYLLFAPHNPGPPPAPKADLVMWGVFDSKPVIEKLIESYHGYASNIQISYVEKDPATYEEDLINALAAGEGPDIFAVHSTWLPKHFKKIAPFAENYIAPADVGNIFPDVVTQDFVADGRVFALPLSIDTLALYYHKNMFDASTIAFPPKTWDQFEQDVVTLKKTDSFTGSVSRAGAAFGGSGKSIDRAADIISLLMLQRGAKMTDPGFTQATFIQGGRFGGNSPAAEALDYYAKFANPATPYYTWNDAFANSIDAFTERRAAMMFNYFYQASAIREKNPFLEYSIAPLPQRDPENPVNYANYWGYAVSGTSQNAEAAWGFIVFSAAYAEHARIYQEATGRSPALRELIEEKKSDPKIGIFAGQALTAQSWRQPDGAAVERIFGTMLEDVITGRLSSDGASRQAAGDITQLIRRSEFLK